MKRIILILSLLIAAIPAINGQWKQTSGPEGGNFTTVYEYNGKLHAVTTNGKIFRKDAEDSWSFLSDSHFDIETVISSDGKLTGITSSGIVISEDGGLSWTGVEIEGYFKGFSLINGQIYTVVNDSIYIFNPVTASFDSTGIKTSLVVNVNGTPVEVSFFGISSLQIINGRVILFAMIPQVAGLAGVFYSDNNGQNWTQAQGITNEFSSREMLTANGVLYLNTFSGLYKSTDNGANWVTAMEGFPSGQQHGFLKMIVFNSEVYLTADNDQVYIVYKYTNNLWTPVETEKNVMRLDVAGNKLYGIAPSSILRYNNTPGDWGSEDNGLVASTTNMFLINENLVFASTWSDNWKTTDLGMTWVKTETEFRGFTKQGNKIFGWSEDGIFVSVDGTNWNISSNGIPPSLYRYISGVADVNGVLYAGINKVRARMHLPPVWEAGGFYRSFDGGASWQFFASGLPSEAGVHAPVYRIMPTPGGFLANTISGSYIMSSEENALRMITGLSTNEGIYDARMHDDSLFIQTYQGIKYSTDFGLNWVQINEGLPNQVYFFISAKMFRYADKLYLIGNQEENVVYELTGSGWIVSEFPAVQGLYYNVIEDTGDKLLASTLERGIWIYTPVTGVEDAETFVSDYKLNQNYPNPFNPSTTLSFSLKNNAMVTLQIFSANGELVETLVSGVLTKGNHNMIWNAKDKTSGVYISVLSILEEGSGKNYRLSNKMIMLK